MKFKELFDKEFLYESKKEDKKTTKIFYEFDINIQKIDEQPADSNTEPPTSTGTVPATDTLTQPVDTGMQPVGVNQPAADVPPLPLASVVTEDDDDKGNNEGEAKVNDENNVIRKLKGEMVLKKEDIDNIQSVEDIINALVENKVDGVNILDEFTSDILQTMANPATQTQLKEKIGQESKIFAQILYGKKLEDSVGVRFIKRKGSDMITTSMMIDNKIVNAQYKKETLDKRITDYRNDEFEEN